MQEVGVPDVGVQEDVERWFARRSSRADDWPLERLLAAKGATRISLVLPARDEERTVEDIVSTLRRALVEDVPLLDEVLVVDSRSSDATAAVARRAGARVVSTRDVLPRHGDRPGKGEALWKALHATTGDVLVFVDADLVDVDPRIVTGLLGPLLCDPGVAFVKGASERPLGAAPTGGGRVTELVARPLLGLHWPRLAGFVQPLGGEYAARREVLEAVPFAGGYGVELGLLVDLLETVGLDALAQVDIGRRMHRHQDAAALGVMAAELWQTALVRLQRAGRVPAHLVRSTSLVQFTRDETSGAGWLPERVDVTLDERPPMASVPEHATRRAA